MTEQDALRAVDKAENALSNCEAEENTADTAVLKAEQHLEGLGMLNVIKRRYAAQALKDAGLALAEKQKRTRAARAHLEKERAALANVRKTAHANKAKADAAAIAARKAPTPTPEPQAASTPFQDPQTGRKTRPRI